MAKNGSFGFTHGLYVFMVFVNASHLRRVGNECRLTRCPFSIWSVCWSPVKMVCPCVNVHFLVVRVNGCCVVLHLPVTVLVLAKKGHLKNVSLGYAPNFNRITNVEACASAPFLPIPC
jgi:hypothetical protein